MRALADTSLFVALEDGRTLTPSGVDEIVVSVVTVAELGYGVLTGRDVARRNRRLATLAFARQLDPLPVDDAVASAWAGLVAALREQGRRAPVNDCWIAATALAHRLPVLTQDGDYDPMPGVAVIRV